MTVAIMIGLALSALVTAAVAGAFGLAGGMVLLGVMTAVLPAASVVPVHGIVQLSSNATRTLLLLPRVRWRVLAVFVVPYVVGIALAGLVWSPAGLPGFDALIGVFLLVFLVWRRITPKARSFPLWIYAPLGFVIGFLALLVGATGVLTAPFFLRDDFDREETVATSAVCQAVAHLLKIPAFLALGFDFVPYLGLTAILVVAAILGTFVGRRWLAGMSDERFTTAFEVILAGLALYLIQQGVRVALLAG